jgi:hypothetical protein
MIHEYTLKGTARPSEFISARGYLINRNNLKLIANMHNESILK